MVLDSQILIAFKFSRLPGLCLVISHPGFQMFKQIVLYVWSDFPLNSAYCVNKWYSFGLAYILFGVLQP